MSQGRQARRSTGTEASGALLDTLEDAERRQANLEDRRSLRAPPADEAVALELPQVRVEVVHLLQLARLPERLALDPAGGRPRVRHDRTEAGQHHVDELADRAADPGLPGQGHEGPLRRVRQRQLPLPRPPGGDRLEGRALPAHGEPPTGSARHARNGTRIRCDAGVASHDETMLDSMYWPTPPAMPARLSTVRAPTRTVRLYGPSSRANASP